jgi:hypothetical protein
VSGDHLDPDALEFFRKKGAKGGHATARKRTASERSTAARKAVLVRWKKKTGKGTGKGIRQPAAAPLNPTAADPRSPQVTALPDTMPATSAPAEDAGAEFMRTIQEILDEQETDAEEKRDPWS